jgi:serine/threonine-protein kinase
LNWKETQSEYLGDLPAPLFISFDAQRYPQGGPEEFFRVLLEQIHAAYPEIDEPWSMRIYESFSRVMEQLRSQEKSLVLLLDEFDLITANPAFEADFYSFMRSMANNYPVAYVTASRAELQKLCHSSLIADSPFFNIFSNLLLRPFSAREAQELIATPSEREGCSLRDYSEELLALAGFFPFYLQIACSVYFETISDDLETRLDRQEVEEQFLEEAGPHFEYFWEHCDSASKRVLRKVIEGEPISDEDLHVCRKLEKKGYLHSIEGEYLPFSGAFARYIEAVFLSNSGENQTTCVVSGAETSDRLIAREVNQYRIVHKVGEGGMGVVYAAEDKLLRRKVALKFCRPDLKQDETLRRRVIQEARLAASLSHPAITSVHELFEYEGQLVLVMEWIEGQNLKQVMLDRGPLDWRTLVGWLSKVCEGLEEAHAKGIVHRDIKPSNIMLTDRGEPKITDFGLAKCVMFKGETISDLTAAGSLLGTVEYMSPEQARGEQVDLRSDLFSLGVVAFEGLTARRPFQGDSIPGILQAIINSPAPPLQIPESPDAERLGPVVQKLLNKSVEQRYQSAVEVHEDLNRLLKKRRLFSYFKR